MSALIQHHPLFVAFAFGVGACIGSFLNVCGYRLPREISVASPNSYCPECGTPIPPKYNLPIVGWLLLRGKAACCGAKISGRYAFIELLTAVFFAVVWWGYPPAEAVAYWVFYSLLMVGILTDFDFLIIPDEVTIGGALTGLVASALVPGIHNTVLIAESMQRSLIGLIVGAVVLWLVGVVGSKALGRDAMGLGDVKLMACIGAFLGWQGAMFSLTLGSLLGSIGGVAVMVLQQRKFGALTTIPFGPALSVAALVWLFGGDRLWALFFKFQMLTGS